MKKSMFGYLNIVWPRAIVCVLLTYLTYNTFSNFSVVSWVQSIDNPGSGALLVSILVVLVHIAFIIAATRGLGRFGSACIVLLIAALVYYLWDIGTFSAKSTSHLINVSQSMYALFLAIGMAASIVWRRATGQIATKETNPEIDDAK